MDPPAIGPLVGPIPETVGAGTANVNLSAAEIAEVPSGLVTWTSMTPAACAGTTAVIDDGELMTNDVAATPPNETAVAFAARPVPAIVDAGSLLRWNRSRGLWR